MVNYVNTVLVGTRTSSIIKEVPTYAADNVGKFMIMNMADGSYVNADDIAYCEAIKIGILTAQSTVSQDGDKMHVIKWSNVIKRNNLKSYHFTEHEDDTPESVELDFTHANVTELSKGNMRVIVRLTNKDMDTRYRKWTDSFEYVTAEGDDATAIANGLAAEIKRNHKRARVSVVANAGKLTLTALPYDDDDTVDTINWAKQVRFSANAYYTNPQASGFASKNKYSINGLKITKTPGKTFQASAKLVRDRESWAMGYQGILNRGCCTWPIIKPVMMTDLTADYDSLVLEFETMYRAADDIQRHTKECLEVYEITGKQVITKAIEAWLTGIDTTDIKFPTTDVD